MPLSVDYSNKSYAVWSFNFKRMLAKAHPNPFLNTEGWRVGGGWIVKLQ